MKNRAWLAVLVSVLGCGGPVGPFSGGALSGESKPVPSDWGFATNVEEVQIETNPAAPHSWNIWIGVKDGAPYISSSMILGAKVPTEREWVRDVVADERVRLRIEGAVYELRAVRVRDAAEAAAARAVLEAKYELEPDDMDPEREVWVFRLEPR